MPKYTQLVNSRYQAHNPNTICLQDMLLKYNILLKQDKVRIQGTVFRLITCNGLNNGLLKKDMFTQYL